MLLTKSRDDRPGYSNSATKSQLLKDGFAGVTRDGLARLIAQAGELRPAGRVPDSRGVLWIDGRRQSDRHAGRPWQNGAVAQEASSARQRNGNDRRAGGHRRLKRTELEWPHAVFGGERAFGEHEDRIAVAPEVFHLFGLAK